MSIRTKLVLVFSVVSAIILLLASVSGYIFARNSYSESIEKQMLATLDSHVNKLDGWLYTKQKLVENTAVNIQTMGEGVPVASLAGYISSDKDLNDVYFGTADGKLVSGTGWVPPADFDPRVRPWYKDAVKQKKAIFTEPYIDAETHALGVSVAVPYQLAGQVRGVVSADIMLPTLVETVKGINIAGQGYAFLVDSKGLIIVHPDTDVVSKNIYEVEKLHSISTVVKDFLGKEKGFKHYQDNGKAMILVYEQIPSTKWTLCINVEQASVFQALEYLKWMFIAITLLSIVAVVIITFAVAARITRPLENLKQQVVLMASGDLTVQAEVNGEDEIARLAAGFNKMAGDLRTMINDIYKSTIDLQNSSNNLIDIASNVAANSEEMSASVSMVSSSVEQISAGTEENASSTEQVCFNVESVAKRANEMSLSAQGAVRTSQSVAEEVKQVSDLIEDVSSSIRQVAVFAQEVATSCRRSIAITEHAKDRSNETSDIIQKLNVSSRQINKIVDIIRNIAEQTNMLALNATIEAASAGEAGRGFAVVAAEVKELSKRTAEEAGRIGLQIETMQNDMNAAVTAVGKITEVIAETMDITQTIAAAVSDQPQGGAQVAGNSDIVKQATTISSEVETIAGKAGLVSRNALDAANGVNDMVQTTVDISRKADEVARSTGEMEAAVQNISQATQEIAKGTQHISENIQETDKAISDTASKATKVSECAYEVGELANRLEELIRKFKV